MAEFANPSEDGELSLFLASSENGERLLLLDIILACSLQLAQKRRSNTSISYLLASAEPAGFMLDLNRGKATLSAERKELPEDVIIYSEEWLNHKYINFKYYNISGVLEDPSLLRKNSIDQSLSLPSEVLSKGIASVSSVRLQETLTPKTQNSTRTFSQITEVRQKEEHESKKL